MMKYSVYLDASSYWETYDRGGDDEWSRPDSYTSWVFNFLSTKRGCHHVDVPFKPVVGATYYAVIAVYSTGDSFGHAANACIEIFSVYETEHDANVAKHKIDNDQKNSTLEFNLPGGKPVKVANPWHGYFESLTSVDVYPLVCRN